jgi:hypothetical protein
MNSPINLLSARPSAWNIAQGKPLLNQDLIPQSTTHMEFVLEPELEAEFFNANMNMSKRRTCKSVRRNI